MFFKGNRSLHPLLPQNYNFGKRRDTFRKTLALLTERKATTLLETGTARAGLKNCKSDGASTIVFGKWARENDAYLYSVDIDSIALKQAEIEIKNYNLSGHVHLKASDSIAFLKLFDQKVDFLYLDSFDYDKKDRSIQRKSQEHHLAEFKAIESRLHQGSIVLIDDHKLPGGGKGKLAIEYMTQKGWEIVMEEYQVLLSQKIIRL
ncbi:MAG: class I SAM-dependent methyltransferase [Bacteroidetes bacterium]|nr:class I SAM-dependent methyltransferase [Bacteroidota bacterium]MDA1121244.1 class I SAM-dependent methyltransferase [Bacteroidota bacterium]